MPENQVMVERSNVGRVAVLRFANPPVNALSIKAGLVPALRAALRDVLEDEAVDAVVIAGKGGIFSAGADIAEFEGDREQLNETRTLVEAFAASSKPVAAAIDGVCAGGGLELALACGLRVATPRSKIGLPEVTLGLLPGAGGTQRLPRLIGAAAVDLLIGGAMVGAARAKELGVIDAVDDDAVAAAIAAVAQTSLPDRPNRAATISDAVLTAAAGKARLPAAQAIIKTIHAAIDLPFAEGLAIEASSFDMLLDSRESKALRHGFTGRRIASRIPGQAPAGAASTRATDSPAFSNAMVMPVPIRPEPITVTFSIRLVPAGACPGIRDAIRRRRPS